jgi:hypothetical protein
VEQSQAHDERPLPLSQRLAQIAEQSGPDRILLSELARELHSRVWGGLLVFGRASPWFPARIDRRGVTKMELETLIAKMGWFEARVERIFQPRLGHLTGPSATRVIGAVCMVLSLIAGLPILMIHNAPAIAIVLFGLALIYRDGVLVIVASIAAVLSVLFDAALIIWGVAVLKFLVGWLHR